MQGVQRDDTWYRLAIWNDGPDSRLGNFQYIHDICGWRVGRQVLYGRPCGRARTAPQIYNHFFNSFLGPNSAKAISHRQPSWDNFRRALVIAEVPTA